jgi:hypothetical protein
LIEDTSDPTGGHVGRTVEFSPEEVTLMADAIKRLSSAAVAEAAMVSRCTDAKDCCPGWTCRLDAYRAAHGAVSSVGVLPYSDAPTEAERPFPAILASWMDLHRAGRFAEAAALRKLMVSRLDRAGIKRES